MNRYIEFVLKYPKLVILTLIIITAALSSGLPKLGFDNSVETFMPKDDTEYKFYNDTKDIYGDNGRFIIMSVTHEKLMSPEIFQHIDALVTDFEEYKDYDESLEQGRIDRFEGFISTGEKTYDELITAFKQDLPFQRLLKRKAEKKFDSGDTLGTEDLRWIEKEILFSKNLKESGAIDKLISPFTSKDISGDDDTLDTYDLIPRDENDKRILPQSEKEFSEFRKKLFRNPAFEKGIFTKDSETGRITDFGIIIKYINLKEQGPISKEILEIIDSHKDQIDILPHGAPVVNVYFNGYLHRDLYAFMPITLFVVVIIFFFNFRSFRGVILPFFSLGMSLFWILGLMGHLGYKITAMGVSLPALMIAVGSSYSIHILNQYYADFKLITDKGRRAGLRITMSHISITVLLAALTTCVAFMTLSSSQLSAIREWGIFSGIGVIFAFFISSSLIPAGLMLMPHKMPFLLLKKNKVKVTLIDKIIALMTNGAINHYKKALAVVIILLAVSVAGIFHLNVESEFLRYFKEDDKIRTGAEIIEKKFGGRWGFNILLESEGVDGVKKAEFLKTVESIRAWLMAPDNSDMCIGRTDGFPDYIKTMHLAMNNDEPSYYRIPDDDMEILDYLEIYSGDDDDFNGRIDEFESYVDQDYRTCNLLVRFSNNKGEPLGTGDTKRILAAVEQYLEKNLPSRYSFKITGFPVMNIKIAHYVVKGQLQSLLLSLLVIALIVMMLFSSVKAGIVALIPMSTAVTINFGIMGWAGINLDTVTSIIAAITIGIGVDDTIHFLNTFRYNLKRGYDVDETIKRTIAVSGKAIIYTSTALVFGFSVLIISSFRPVILFGVLMAVTMTATTIGALLVLPAVIKLTGMSLDVAESRTGFWRYLSLGRIFGLEQKK